MREENSGFEDGPICGALVEFSREEGGVGMIVAAGDGTRGLTRQCILFHQVRRNFLEQLHFKFSRPFLQQLRNDIPKANNDKAAPSEPMLKKKKSKEGTM